jgi:hypothetical protein
VIDLSLSANLIELLFAILIDFLMLEQDERGDKQRGDSTLTFS